MSLTVKPCTIKAAKQFVREVHRHHPAVTGAMFATSVVDETGAIRGVVMVGRPARMLWDGWTADATRVATDGARNGCSMLYAAAWRAARALGFRRMVTYTLESESGASLRAAGAIDCGLNKGGEYSRPSRARKPATYSTEPKRRWEWRAEPPPDAP